jgi:hypothetical protein
MAQVFFFMANYRMDSIWGKIKQVPLAAVLFQFEKAN